MINNNSTIGNGDTVVAEGYFGNKELIFVGMAKGLQFGADCVVLYNNKPITTVFSLLSKVNPAEAI